MSRRVVLGVLLIAIVFPGAADAHFKLNAPTSMTMQDAQGSPQKSAPCGITDSPIDPDQSTPTNAVTMLRTGSLITISINETINHPGHYRVSLAQDAASLPADPLVTAGSTACGSTVINPTPTLPLLADGLLQHTSSAGGVTQTMQVQLPAGMTCTNCVLQVTQFMSNHAINNPGGCFYHHCAVVTIANDAPPEVDAGTGEPGDLEGGCCSAERGLAASTVVLTLAVVMGLGLRRRRRPTTAA